MLPSIPLVNVVNVISVLAHDGFLSQILRSSRICSSVKQREYSLSSKLRVRNTPGLSTSDDVPFSGAFALSDFSKIYSGDFCNDRQLTEQPGVQYARKLHIPIEAPILGDHCYFVKEETRRTSEMQYRLRIAVFEILQKVPEIVLRGKHFDFRDSGPLEPDLPPDRYIAVAQVAVQTSTESCRIHSVACSSIVRRPCAIAHPYV